MIFPRLSFAYHWRLQSPLELKPSAAATRWLLHPLSVSSSLTTADSGELNNHLLTISNARTHVTNRSADIQSVDRLVESFRSWKRDHSRTYRSLCPRESSMTFTNECFRSRENITASKNRAPLGFCIRRTCERVIGIRNSRSVATEIGYVPADVDCPNAQTVLHS